jgi:hypothetical protein
MTPQERELVNGLFDRLAQLESAPRDPEAEKAIIDGLRRAPNAVYALVQTALVQDEALRRANDRIQELESEAGAAQQAPRPAGFLDSMREALTGGRDGSRAGSVPSVRPGGPPLGAPAAAPVYAGPQAGYGGGGSFLGTAASTAAGVIGGSLLLDGIRSMMGHHSGFGVADGGYERRSPWDGGDSELAREAGIDDVGSTHHSRDDGAGSGASDHAAGFYDSDNDDTAGNQSDQDVADADDDADADFGGDFGGDSGGSSDA